MNPLFLTVAKETARQHRNKKEATPPLPTTAKSGDELVEFHGGIDPRGGLNFEIASGGPELFLLPAAAREGEDISRLFTADCNKFEF